MRELIYYGRFYHEHTSKRLPVMTDDEGRSTSVEQQLKHHNEVYVRNATLVEHLEMVVHFDKSIREQAAEGWIYGLGNYDPADPPEEMFIRIGELLAMALEYANTRGKVAVM